MKWQDGLYEKREQEMKPIVHVIRIQNNKVVEAWVYQVEGEYREPGFASSVVGKAIADLDMTGYKKQH